MPDLVKKSAEQAADDEERRLMDAFLAAVWAAPVPLEMSRAISAAFQAWRQAEMRRVLLLYKSIDNTIAEITFSTTTIDQTIASAMPNETPSEGALERAREDANAEAIARKAARAIDAMIDGCTCAAGHAGESCTLDCKAPAWSRS